MKTFQIKKVERCCWCPFSRAKQFHYCTLSGSMLMPIHRDGGAKWKALKPPKECRLRFGQVKVRLEKDKP